MLVSIRCRKSDSYEIVRTAIREGNIEPDNGRAESMAGRVLNAYAHGIRDNAALFDVAMQILPSPKRGMPDTQPPL